MEKKKLSSEDFEFLSILGEGSYGQVVLVTKKNDPTKKLFALKMIDKNFLQRVIFLN